MTQRGSSRPRSSKQDKPIIIKRGSIRVQIYRQKRVVAGVEYHQHVVVWVDATGKRIRKTFSDLTSATALAEQTATALSRGDWAASTFTGTDASIYADACERVARFRVSLTEAISEFGAARSKLPSGVSLIEVVSDYLQRHPIGAVQKTVSEVLSEFIRDREAAKCSTVHLRDIRSRLGQFAGAFQMPIQSLTALLVRDWLRSLKKPNGDPLTTRTLNNLLRLIGSLLHFARRQKDLNRDLVEEITEIDLGRNAPTETGIFSPEDLRKLLDHCPEDLIAPLAIGAFCGLRTSELGRLDWRAVDLASGFIRIEAKIAKTASRRLIPIPDNLREWLQPIAQKEGPINPSTDDRGLNHRLVRGPARSAHVAWVKNGLRHSFCSYRLAQTSNAAQVALEAGNSPTMIFRHYRELVTPDQAQEWFSIRPMAAVVS